MFNSTAMSMLLAKALGARPASEPKTHDYSRQCWGHAASILRVIDGGKKLRVGGHGHGISGGDFLVLPNEGATTRYRVDRIEYMRDPTDQWFADLTFAPREKV